MNPQKQRVTIAVKVGYRAGSHCIYDQVSPEEQIHRYDCPCNGTGWNIPDYLNDLNAVHEVEKVLDTTNGGIRSPNCLRYEYARQLYSVVSEDEQPCRATAAQRCEALLRTWGLWEEGE